MGKIKSRECQNVEFKSSWNDKYLEWICGFANAQGAVMYFGVNDDHEVIGLKQTKKLLEDIPNKIVNAMGLVVDVNLHEQDGLEYIEVVIDPASVPISYKGKYYYRSGSTMQELTGTALTDFIMRKLNVTWDAATEPSAKIEDIDPEAIKFFLNAAIREGRISESARNDSIEQLLRKLHLINEENGYLTMAALLLFGKDVERWNMTVAFRIGRFGSSQADLIIQDRIACPLIMMPSRVVDILRTKYLVAPIHYEGMQRIEPLEIPEDGLREMICNAIIHKDYTGTFIQMKVFDDYITLWNGGMLPPNYSVEKLMQPHESHPRNRLMANVFYLAGFIEAWGRGYEKIRDAFKAEKLEMPVFEEVRGGFMATIKREKFMAIQKGQNVTSPVTSPASSLSVVQLTERQKSVVSRLFETGQKIVLDDVLKDALENVLKDVQKDVLENALENVLETSASLAAYLKVNERTIRRDLSTLQAKRIICHIGPDKGGRWIILVSHK